MGKERNDGLEQCEVAGPGAAWGAAHQIVIRPGLPGDPAMAKGGAAGRRPRATRRSQQQRARNGSKVTNLDGTLDTWRPRVLAVLRIMTALLFLAHGTGKLLGFPELSFSPAPMSLPWIAGVLEIVGGLLLLIGLFTRPVAFILCGMMAVAYFMAHAPQGFHPILNGGELAVLYCFVFLYFTFAGPGDWSVDAARKSA